MSDRDDILADRLNVEPAIFKGCSSSELGIIAGVTALIWLPVSLLLAGLLDAVNMGFGMAGVGVVGTVIVMTGLFQRLKPGRPDGYYQQQIAIWLSAMVCAARRSFGAVAPGILGENGMRRYRTEIDNVRAHLRSLWVVIGLQFVVILVLWFGWS
jgi:conjugative transfer region protein (TIGR03750 family)